MLIDMANDRDNAEEIVRQTVKGSADAQEAKQRLEQHEYRPPVRIIVQDGGQEGFDVLLLLLPGQCPRAIKCPF